MKKVYVLQFSTRDKQQSVYAFNSLLDLVTYITENQSELLGLSVTSFDVLNSTSKSAKSANNEK